MRTKTVGREETLYVALPKVLWTNQQRGQNHIHFGRIVPILAGPATVLPLTVPATLPCFELVESWQLFGLRQQAWQLAPHRCLQCRTAVSHNASVAR